MPRLFGEKLRALRRQHGLTQVELARRLALASHAHIAKLEAGHDVPSLGLVLRGARVFGTSTDYLLRDTIPVEEAAASTAGDRGGGDESPSVFGARLRALRLQASLTQAALARRLGLARQGYISNLEAGRKAPSLDLVVQIADVFGVTIDYLLLDTTPIEQIVADRGRERPESPPVA